MLEYILSQIERNNPEFYQATADYTHDVMFLSLVGLMLLVWAFLRRYIAPSDSSVTAHCSSPPVHASTLRVSSFFEIVSSVLGFGLVIVVGASCNEDYVDSLCISYASYCEAYEEKASLLLSPLSIVLEDPNLCLERQPIAIGFQEPGGDYPRPFSLFSETGEEVDRELSKIYDTAPPLGDRWIGPEKPLDPSLSSSPVTSAQPLQEKASLVGGAIDEKKGPNGEISAAPAPGFDQTSLVGFSLAPDQQVVHTGGPSSGFRQVAAPAPPVSPSIGVSSLVDKAPSVADLPKEPAPPEMFHKFEHGPTNEEGYQLSFMGVAYSPMPEYGTTHYIDGGLKLTEKQYYAYVAYEMNR